MKILLINLLCILVLTPVCATAKTGVEFSADSSKPATDFDTDSTYMYAKMPSYYTSISAAVTPNNFNPQLRVFTEGNAPLKMGVALGLGYISPLKYDVQCAKTSQSFTQHYALDSFILPVELYLKYRPAGEKLSLSIGAGEQLAYNRIQLDFEHNSSRAEGTFTAASLMPYANAEAELFLFKNVSLVFDFKYLFNGSVTGFKGTLSDPDNIAGGNGTYTLSMENIGGDEHIYPLRDGGAQPPLGRDFKADYTALWSRMALRIYF